MAEKKPTTTPPADDGWRRARGPLVVARLTERLTRTALGKRGFTGADIIGRWPEIVGADLAAFACPLQVKYPKGRNEGATLLLRVSSGAAATMLQMKTPTIIDRVNRFFGYGAVARLEASHGPLPKAKAKVAPVPPAPPSAAVEALTATIQSDDLRTALRKLGDRLQHRRGPGVVKAADTKPSPGKVSQS